MMSDKGEKTRPKPTIVDWKVKVKVWQSLVRNPRNITAICRDIESHTGDEDLAKYALDRATVKRICKELPILPSSLVGDLPPEVQEYVSIFEEREKHGEDLRKLVQEWKSQLALDVADVFTRYDINFPSSFRKEDVLSSGHYWKGGLHWLVGPDGTIEVRFPAERNPLFPLLKVHLPSKELWNSFDKLKKHLRETLEEAASNEENVVVTLKSPLTLVCQIVDELDRVLAKRMFPGKCEICPDFTDIMK
jgi:hypothetical protein